MEGIGGSGGSSEGKKWWYMVGGYGSGDSA